MERNPDFSLKKDKTLRMTDFLNEFANDNIGFDIDGTIDYTAGPAVRNYHREFGRISRVRYEEDLNHYYAMTDWLVKDHGMDPESAMANAIRIWNDHNTVLTSKPEAGAIALIRYLTSRKIPITPHFITSRPARNSEITKQWIAQYFPMIPPNHIHIQRTTAYDNKFKADTVERLGLKYYFEDSIDHAKELAAIVVPGFGNVIVGFIRQPWNINFIPDPNSSIVVNSDLYLGRSNVIQTYLTVFEYWKRKRLER